MLIQLYILCLVASAALLVASLLLGDRADQAVGDRARTSSVVEFWMFFAAFFGIGGLLFDGLDLLGPPSAAAAAMALGLIAALGSRWVARRAAS